MAATVSRGIACGYRGWVQRVSNKKNKGRVYYVNLRTKKFQRERPVADHVSAQVEEAASQGPVKKQKMKPKVANVSDALVRLGVVMKKEEKFAKAATMFVQLMENNMTEENSGDFLAVIDGAMERRTWIHAQVTVFAVILLDCGLIRV